MLCSIFVDRVFLCFYFVVPDSGFFSLVHDRVPVFNSAR